MRSEEDCIYQIANIYNQLSNSPITEYQYLTLSYLADYRYRKLHDIALFRTDYIMYNTGPHSGRIIDLIQDINENHAFHKIEKQISGERKNVFVRCNCPMHNYNPSDILGAVREVLRNIVFSYISYNDIQLKNYIMERSEIKNAEKYSKIQI